MQRCKRHGRYTIPKLELYFFLFRRRSLCAAGEHTQQRRERSVSTLKRAHRHSLPVSVSFALRVRERR